MAKWWTDPAQQLHPPGLDPGHPSGPSGRLRFHDLRHTAATLAVAAGAGTRELMVRMGHSSLAAGPAVPARHGRPGAATAAALDELVQAASTRSG